MYGHSAEPKSAFHYPSVQETSKIRTKIFHTDDRDQVSDHDWYSRDSL